MKKIILMLIVAGLVSLPVVSCKKEKKEAKTEELAKEELELEAGGGMATNDVLYQCPMDCEKGKSYTEPGKCPVCKMDLKEKKVDMDEAHKDKDDHGHHKDSMK